MSQETDMPGAMPWRTEREVAAWLRFSVRSIQRLRKAGKIPYRTMPDGGHIRYSPEDQLAVIEALRYHPAGTTRPEPEGPARRRRRPRPAEGRPPVDAGGRPVKRPRSE